MFWIVYVLICVSELCLDGVFYIEYLLLRSTKPTMIIISTIIFFAMYIFCFPVILLSIKGYGLVTGVPVTKNLGKLVYMPTLISFVLLLILILTPWSRILKLIH